MNKHNTPYSPYKVVHHQERIEDMRQGKLPTPLQVQLVISDWCNHNCNFCAYRMDGYDSNQLFGEKKEDGTVQNNPVRMIPAEKCIEILDDFKDMGIEAMQFTGGGEPTVHPKHDIIFEHCVKLGLDLALVTNGAKMKDNVVQALVKGGKWVRISIDAGIEQTYCDVREVKPFMFEKVWGNVKKLSDARNAFKESELIIGIGFVITPDNWNEIIPFMKRAVINGADNVRFSAMFSHIDGVHDSYFKECSKLLKEAKEQFGQDIKIFDLFSDRVEDLEQKSPDYKHCGYMKLNVYIGGDQNVYTCCNNAYNVKGLVGTIKDKTFREFWEAKETREFYGGFDAHGCARCMFNNKNHFINYLLADDPQHVNYI